MFAVSIDSLLVFYYNVMYNIWNHVGDIFRDIWAGLPQCVISICYRLWYQNYSVRSLPSTVWCSRTLSSTYIHDIQWNKHIGITHFLSMIICIDRPFYYQVSVSTLLRYKFRTARLVMYFPVLLCNRLSNNILPY